MPYVRVETDVWLSPEEVGTAISKQDLDKLLRFVKAARSAVDVLFDAGELDPGKELFAAGEPIAEMFDLGKKVWPSLRADDAYYKWRAARDAASVAK